MSILEEFREFTRETAFYSEDVTLPYLVAGLCSEAGEVAGKYKKYMRDVPPWDDFVEDVAKELGDVMWYVVRLADELELDLTTILEMNVAKLTARKAAGTLSGSGDNR